MNGNTGIQYREIQPSPALSLWIQNHWTMRVNRLPSDRYPHHVLPDGCVYKGIKPGASWDEAGRISRDGGATWYPFFEMHLKADTSASSG